MLNINKTKFKKFRIPLIISCLILGGIFFYQYLTFIPEYSSATTISTDTPVTITPTTPLAKWEDLEYMQQMTPQACADAKENDSKPLIDNRDTNRSYDVTKLKDGAGCWMTRNMAHKDGRMYYSKADGGYYNFENAKKVCDFTGWQLPTKEQYQTLFIAYGIQSGSTGSETLRKSPLNFKYSGLFDKGGSLPIGTGNYGRYWTSSIESDDVYFLRFDSDNAYLDSISYSISSAKSGMSVRCVAQTTSTVTPVTPPEPGSSSGISDPTLSVTIPKVLTLDVTNSVNIETNPNNISTGTFTASVTSNANYSISLNATSEDASATSLVNIKDNKKVAEIPTITSTTQPTIGTSSWGIRKCNNLTTETCIENYKPLPTKNSTTGNPFLTSTPGNHQHLFQIGIGIGPELPSGTYTTSITVTASQN